MSDLVKELRASVALDAVHGDPQERMVCANQMARAADEIERLCADNNELRSLFELQQTRMASAESLEYAVREWAAGRLTDDGLKEQLEASTAGVE